MKKLLLPIFDAGHGGVVRNENGQSVYTTAPRKMFKHKDGSIAYEGVINRQIKEAIIKIWAAYDRPYIDVSATNLDLSLENRVLLADGATAQFKGKYNILYLAIHLNGGNGSGFEIFTSIGETKSDKYATIWGKCLIEEFPNVKFRKDQSDGDLDKEVDFYVLRKTDCPSVLGELGFFDNVIDWKLIQSKDFIERVAKATIKFLLRAEKEIE